ncbi:RNA polymerase sporulation-specific sigma factor [Alkalithermobacter thermoalcaliphilus JW-YL-7 = DSM 7308]|uniref:RNA polymerase sigma factor n=1 Tax=Alkalithermobacter thermoalcaliphilus JW-YL-7 = DSM 7308 TaxID=1121328 RepID=A0A150FRK4_CLOPD|nr:RNA polymerase, sigma 28 subunit, SigK [[Clostridium] paradoxum JW-YL-7 = DSM 7308]SHK65263.1 RNA polymerase sporulation-specific sigma factor [[Clostridium] paradoxum JW-YL-7 = DSM 7308]
MPSTKSFPKPLTPKEELEYLKKFKEGDEQFKTILIERNLRLVAHIVKKYTNYYEDAEDLISIGTIGLIKAIETYNMEKGTRLATYAARCIDNEILMMLRSNKKNKSEVSLHDPIGVDKEGNEITLMDILGTELDDVIDEVDLKIKVKKLYEKINNILTNREKEIIELRYGLTSSGYKTQRDIAKKLQISRSYVSRIEKRALKKLKKCLECEKE